jgi:hypothetical protein
LWLSGKDRTKLRARSAGGAAEGLLYSLNESAKLCGVEPSAYLGAASRRRFAIDRSAPSETPGAGHLFADV